MRDDYGLNRAERAAARAEFGRVRDIIVDCFDHEDPDEAARYLREEAHTLMVHVVRLGRILGEPRMDDPK